MSCNWVLCPLWVELEVPHFLTHATTTTACWRTFLLVGGVGEHFKIFFLFKKKTK